MNNSSPRMALKLLDPPIAAGLSTFCARCGAPPLAPRPSEGGWRESRVCAHCGLGLLLRTPLQVARDSPFLVLDRALHVSAMSGRAEGILGTSEQLAVGLAVGRLLEASEQPGQFTALLHDAVLGGGASDGVPCWIVNAPERSLRVHVGPCGPPPGALLLLEPTSD